MEFDLPPFIVWIALGIINTYRYSDFQVNIFSNNRDITKCQSFCTTMTTTRTPTRLQQYIGFSPKTAELKMLVTYIFSFSFNVLIGPLSHVRLKLDCVESVTFPHKCNRSFTREIETK